MEPCSVKCIEPAGAGDRPVDTLTGWYPPAGTVPQTVRGWDNATARGVRMMPLRSKQKTFDAAPVYLSAGDCRLAHLIDLVNQKTDLADYPYAYATEQNVLIYDGA